MVCITLFSQWYKHFENILLQHDIRMRFNNERDHSKVLTNAIVVSERCSTSTDMRDSTDVDNVNDITEYWYYWWEWLWWW